MNDLHRVHLSLGSNIEPEVNLPQAIRLLREFGRVEAVSSAWESRALGSEGPNFLNLCARFLCSLGPADLKETIIRPIEARLGRVRDADRNAPRTIDIDIVLFDERPLNTDFWEYAFVTVPLAELIPEFPHPNRGVRTARVAGQLQRQTWIVKRSDVIVDPAGASPV
jgi:2-amino-4-hydroxy-6-hydroxymethyldihydropteridine diphosphokinase